MVCEILQMIPSMVFLRWVLHGDILKHFFWRNINQNLVIDKACEYLFLIRVFLKLFRIPRESVLFVWLGYGDCLAARLVSVCWTHPILSRLLQRVPQLSFELGYQSSHEAKTWLILCRASSSHHWGVWEIRTIKNQSWGLWCLKVLR